MCLISSILVTGVDISKSFSDISATVALMPRCSSIGETPAARCLWDSTRIERARIVEVVVPSPALSFVSIAACLIIWTAAFSMGSSRETKWATVTPSLVMKGVFPTSWRSTLRPRGPRVDATLSAKMLAPLNIFCCSDWLSSYSRPINTSKLCLYYNRLCGECQMLFTQYL